MLLLLCLQTRRPKILHNYVVPMSLTSSAFSLAQALAYVSAKACSLLLLPPMLLMKLASERATDAKEPGQAPKA